MNKLILLFFCLFSISIQAQDTLVNTNSTAVHYSEKDLKVDDSIFTPTKFPSNLREKYNSNDFQYEVKVAEKGLWDRFVEWLSYWFKRLFGITDSKSTDEAIDVVLKIIATIIICYVIYMIVKITLNKEGEWVFGKSTTKKIVEHDDIERNLKYIDFEKLIRDTLNSGDRRLAIRYYYLWLLKKMSEKSIIEWNAEKTNSDYLYEIQSESLRKDFNYASYLYNYIWYGEFDLDDETFEKAKQSLEKIVQSV